MFKTRPLVLAIAMASSAAAYAESETNKTDQNYLEEVTIIGSKSNAKTIAGSATVLDSEDLAVFNFTDINQVLADIPGVYATSEEGFGLRPNIGIRGSGTERSGKVTVMEDGVLVAPAPYSNPEAYYFPTTSRMAGVEVLKGTPVLAHGPATVGGAINFISTPIPSEELAGSIKAEYGENNNHRALGNIGGSGDVYGWLIEGQQYGSDGFHDIDNSSNDAGFDKQDVMAKFRLNTPSSNKGIYQQLDIKVQYAEESSDQSYAGTTDADFDADPDRRYGLTAEDQMNNDRTSASMNYLISVNDSLDVTALAYYAKYKRDWFKLNKINGGGISGVIGDANNGDQGAQDILDGTAEADLRIKHNNREYTSQGFQLAADYSFNTASVAHQLNTGVRFHSDEMDRYQPEEDWYQNANGNLSYVGDHTGGVIKGSNNRIESGDAVSFWAVDTIAVNDKLNVTLALRYEDAETERKQYDDNNRNILASTRNNSVEEWLPGAAFTYQVSDAFQLLAGAHKGMALPSGGAKEGTDPELSINYEFGGRYNSGDFSGELIGFYSDYENTVQNCSNANPCDDDATTGSYSLGESEVQGLEAVLAYDGLATDSLTFPLSATYTYTDAEISTTADGGEYTKGDEIRYIPENQLALTAGVVASGWSSHLRAKYVSSSCTQTGCNQADDNTFSKTDDLFVIDFVARIDLAANTSTYVKVDNILNEQEIVSRSPYGARGNKPRTAIIGVDFNF